ncbi:MAG: hypothetical protein ABIJ52_17700 [Pseudomonadota bacterium]
MEVISEGFGRLFTTPDADKAREYFCRKNRALKPKVMLVKDAVEKYIHDGDYSSFEGFGRNQTPVAAGHEIIRQGRKNLGFSVYIVGLEARGLSPKPLRYVESGRVEATEWTNYALAGWLNAAFGMNV